MDGRAAGRDQRCCRWQSPAQEQKPFVEARGSVKPVRLPPGGPTPRMADGKPTSRACGFPARRERANAWSVVPDERVVEDPIPFQPWAKKKLRHHEPDAKRSCSGTPT